MSERSFNKDSVMKGIVWFLALSFGLAWGIWEFAVQSGVSVTGLGFEPYALAGGFAPAVAAIIVRKWITREGFGDAGLGLGLKHWRIYLFAWLLPLGVGAVILLEAMTLGIGRPDLTLARAMAAHPAIREMGI